MKTLEEILTMIDEKCPDTRSSHKLFIAAMIQDAYQDGYKDASEQALKHIKGAYNDTA